MTTAHPRLLRGYRPRPGVHDEMVTPDGVVRAHWREVAGALESLPPADLATRRDEIARQLADDGVSHHDGRGPDAGDWRLDALPLVVPADEWAGIEAGIVQRAELLDLVLADLYGPRDLLRRGLLPPEVVFGHPGFVHAVDGVDVPGPSTLVTLAVDLVRDADGGLVVLSDRAQSPSGAGYALENRLVLSRVFPSLYRSMPVHRLAPFFRSLRAALQAAAPTGVDDPRIVVLSPGPSDETAFEHALLASTLGGALVEGHDLVARRGRLWLRTLDRLEPIDVVLRRVDAAWCDPLELRGDSRVGVPGLVEAVRAGTVTVVNPLGAGIVENPALLAFLPHLATHLLGQELRVPSVRTWWCGDPQQRREVLARLDDLVLKPIARTSGPASILGADLSSQARADLRTRIEAEPHRWVGQDHVDVGAVPTFLDGGLVARRSVLRTFAVAREGSYTMMPGGLTRVAADDEVLVSNQSGKHSKDTWVLSSEPESTAAYWLRPGPSEPLSPSGTMSARAAENLFWMGRYAERAEGLVRLLRVVEERRTDLASSAGADPAGRLTLTVLLRTLGQVTGIDTLGRDGDPTALPDAAVRRLLVDRDVPGTLAHDLHRVERTARVVRDQLSLDTWTVLTALRRDVGAATGDQSSTSTGGLAGDDLLARGRLGRILTSLLALQGLAAESTTQDPGWRFLDAGRRLERGLHVITLLDGVVLDDHGTAADSLLYESLLTACESIVTYRRRYRSQAQLATVLDLLLLDATNPRSIAHQLDRLSNDLQALPGHPGRGRSSEAQRPVLDAATALRLADTARLADQVASGASEDLQLLLTTLRTRLRHTSDLVDVHHFRHRKPQRGVALGGVDATVSSWQVDAGGDLP